MTGYELTVILVAVIAIFFVGGAILAAFNKANNISWWDWRDPARDVRDNDSGKPA